MSLHDNLKAIENLIGKSALDMSVRLANVEERLRDRIATAEQRLDSAIGCEEESDDEDE